MTPDPPGGGIGNYSGDVEGDDYPVQAAPISQAELDAAIAALLASANAWTDTQTFANGLATGFINGPVNVVNGAGSATAPVNPNDYTNKQYVDAHSSLVGLAKRTVNFTYVSTGAAQDLPDLELTVQGDNARYMEVELVIPQFQVQIPATTALDIFLQILEDDESVVYGASEMVLVNDTGAPTGIYHQQIVKAILDPFAGSKDLKVDLTVAPGVTVLEAGGFEDGTFKAPASLRARWL